eukprot:SAG31_NODE_19405_length_603_cov_0.996032_1_plen_40_part_01
MADDAAANAADGAPPQVRADVDAATNAADDAPPQVRPRYL